MLHCAYELRRLDDDVAKCALLTGALGFVRSSHGVTCGRCIEEQWWGQGVADPVAFVEKVRKAEALMRKDGQPLGDHLAGVIQAEAEAVCLANPQLAKLYKGGLRGRLLSGDLPRYQRPNPVNPSAAFAKVVVLEGKPRAKELLQEMFYRWNERTPATGGHPPEVVAQKLDALAAEHDISLTGGLIDGKA